MDTFNKQRKSLGQIYQEDNALNVEKKSQEYRDFFAKKTQLSDNEINSRYIDMVKYFYDLVTDFYEYAWGRSFHFAYPFNNETYQSAIKRIEHYFAYRLGIKQGDILLDVGCGVGGPMREVARFSGARVIGLNNNAYQIKKGEKYNQESSLAALCSFVNGDFTQPLTFEDNTFDGVFSFEAICYARNTAEVYKEMFRVLKPGTYFTGTDWCMTAKYSPRDPHHIKIKQGIEKGNGIYNLCSSDNIINSLKKCGFELIETKDLASEAISNTWYEPLQSGWSIKGFSRTTPGRFLTTQMIRVMELLRFVPRGSTSVTHFLNCGADNLIKGGQLGIFTPGFFFLARKPLG